MAQALDQETKQLKTALKARQTEIQVAKHVLDVDDILQFCLWCEIHQGAAWDTHVVPEDKTGACGVDMLKHNIQTPPKLILSSSTKFCAQALQTRGTVQMKHDSYVHTKLNTK